jgi:hypothetical protein
MGALVGQHLPEVTTTDTHELLAPNLDRRSQGSPTSFPHTTGRDRRSRRWCRHCAAMTVRSCTLNRHIPLTQTASECTITPANIHPTDRSNMSLPQLLHNGWLGRTRRHVFVCGMPRSGTGALRRSLETQPEFGGRESGSPETWIFARPNLICRPDSTGGQRMYEFLTNDGVRRTVSSHFSQVRSIDRVLAAIPTASRDNSFTAIRRHLARAFFESHIRATGAERLVEKTPRHLHHVDRIIKTFPRASVLATVRHPVNCLASRRKRAAREGEAAARWLRVSAHEFAGEYGEDVGYALRAMTVFPNHVRLLRYETLVADPLTTLRSVFDSLSAEFNEGVYLRREDAGTYGWDAPIKDTSTNWREFVTDDEAVYLERSLEIEMNLLNYSPLER